MSYAPLRRVLARAALPLAVVLAFLTASAGAARAADVPGCTAPLERVFLQLSGMG